MVRQIVYCSLLGLALLLGFVIGRRSAQVSLSWRVVARVGDRTFYQGDLEKQLRLFEPRALEIMCYQYLVEEEARKRHLVVPPTKKQVGLDGVGLQIHQLVGEIALQGISDEYLRNVYRSFSEQLATYDLEPAWILSESSLNSFRNGLSSHVDFDTLRSQCASSLPPQIQTEELTLQQCQDLFGRTAKQEVARLQVGQISRAIPYQDGVLFLRLKAARRGYLELLPRIKSLVMESRRQRVLNTIFRRAEIRSEMYTPRLFRQPGPMEVLEPTKGLQKPAATPHPEADKALPRFEETPGTKEAS